MSNLHVSETFTHSDGAVLLALLAIPTGLVTKEALEGVSTGNTDCKKLSRECI